MEPLFLWGRRPLSAVTFSQTNFQRKHEKIKSTVKCCLNSQTNWPTQAWKNQEYSEVLLELSDQLLANASRVTNNQLLSTNAVE